MQLKYILSLLGFLLLAVTSCKTDEKTGINYKTISEELCKCAQPSILLNEEMKALGEANKKEELKTLFPKAGKTFDKVMECANDYLFARSIAEMDKTKLRAALLKNCAGIPPRMVSEILVKVK